MNAQERQAQLLAALHEAIAEDGQAPTVRQLAAAVGLASPSTVAHHLRQMEQAGLVRRDPEAPQGRYLPAH